MMIALSTDTLLMQPPQVTNPLHAPEVLEWVKSAQAGDQAAFGNLVERFQRDVYAKAYSILRSHGDADDVVQETFLRAYRALPNFRFESSFRTWIITIATRQALGAKDHLRLNHYPLETEEEGKDHPALRVEEPQTAAVLDHESRRLLREALPHLPERQKEALMLKICNEWKYERIAQEMGISIGSVKAHVFHAIQNLARHIKGGVS